MADLANTLLKVVDKALNAFGTLQKKCIVIRFVQAYDDIQQKIIETEESHENIPIIFTNFNSEEMRAFEKTESILPSDEKGLVSPLRYPFDDVMPGDKIVKPDGSMMNVVGKLKSPGESLFIAILRGI